MTLRTNTQLILATFILVIASLSGAEPIFEDATKPLNLGIGGGKLLGVTLTTTAGKTFMMAACGSMNAVKSFHDLPAKDPRAMAYGAIMIMTAGWIFIPGRTESYIAMSPVKNLPMSLPCL